MTGMHPADLHKLGYSPLWVEYGLLTERQLHKQLAELEKGRDRHTQRYRYLTFRNFISRQPLVIPDTLLNNLMEVIRSEQDLNLAMSMGLDLLKTGERTEQQFGLIARFLLSEFGEQMQPHIDRETRWRQKRS